MFQNSSLVTIFGSSSLARANGLTDSPRRGHRHPLQGRAGEVSDQSINYRAIAGNALRPQGKKTVHLTSAGTMLSMD